MRGDFNGEGHLVGIEIDNTSEVIDLSRLEGKVLPITKLSLIQRKRPLFTKQKYGKIKREEGRDGHADGRFREN